MSERTRNHLLVAITLIALPIAIEGTRTRASETVPKIGVLEVNATYKDNDGTVRPFEDVELELECDRAAGFPRMRTDAKGHATIRAYYSMCKLSARSSDTDGRRQHLWESHVEFSRKIASVDLSSDNASLVPVLIHSVEPEYPEELRAAGIGGSVVIRTVVRRNGTVGGVSVLSSSNSKFNRSAVAAIKQRKYEPALENGWPVEVELTATVAFGLPLASASAAPGGEPSMPTGDVVFPVVVRKVEPIYPDDARLARIEGHVILQAIVDKNGDVTEVTVLESTNPRFNEAAMEAVRQRKYKPAIKDGKPIAIYFTIRVDFRLR